MEKVAIVILNWNGRKMLEQYLPNVLQHSADVATVIVADNASTDDSVAWLRGYHPEVRRIELDRNWGFADGYNQALDRVEAEYYVLLNSDVEVTEHWLTPLVEYMDQNRDVAVCQPKLLSAYDRHAFEYAGACGGFLDKFGYPFCRGRIFDVTENDEGQYDTVADLLWATGACLMIRREDYWRAGGLDGNFFAHHEEIDLCWRLYLRGRRICCVPDSKVYHVGGGTLPKGNPRKTYLNFRNNLTMLYKNLPEGELSRIMRWRWGLDYLAAFEALILKRNVGDFKAIFKARRDFRRWKNDFDDKRQAVQQDRVAGRSGCQPYSILWQYYAKQRRTFSSLPSAIL